MKPLIALINQVIVVYQIQGCTKNTCFNKSKHFSCSVSSTLIRADVRRGGGRVGQMWTDADRGWEVKNGHFCGRPLWTAPYLIYS